MSFREIKAIQRKVKSSGGRWTQVYVPVGTTRKDTNSIFLEFIGCPIPEEIKTLGELLDRFDDVTLLPDDSIDWDEVDKGNIYDFTTAVRSLAEKNLRE